MMRQLMRQIPLPVSVWFKYDHVARRVVVKKILWSGREMRVRQRARTVLVRRGAARRRLFFCASSGGMEFTLSQDHQTGQWHLLEARNHLGDLIEP